MLLLLTGVIHGRNARVGYGTCLTLLTMELSNGFVCSRDELDVNSSSMHLLIFVLHLCTFLYDFQYFKVEVAVGEVLVSVRKG